LPVINSGSAPTDCLRYNKIAFLHLIASLRRRAWFDRLTMRNVEDCGEPRPVTPAIIFAKHKHPHGEPVEPRRCDVPACSTHRAVC
jgi:hypothetical protein